MTRKWTVCALTDLISLLQFAQVTQSENASSLFLENTVSILFWRMRAYHRYYFTHVLCSEYNHALKLLYHSINDYVCITNMLYCNMSVLFEVFNNLHAFWPENGSGSFQMKRVTRVFHLKNWAYHHFCVHHTYLFFRRWFHYFVSLICITWHGQARLKSILGKIWVIDLYLSRNLYWRLLFRTAAPSLLPACDPTFPHILLCFHLHFLSNLLSFILFLIQFFMIPLFINVLFFHLPSNFDHHRLDLSRWRHSDCSSVFTRNTEQRSLDSPSSPLSLPRRGCFHPYWPVQNTKFFFTGKSQAHL